MIISEHDLGEVPKELETIEVGSFESIFNHLNITKPSMLRGKSVAEYLEKVKWSEDKGRKLANFWKHGKHYQFCSKPGKRRVDLDVR